MCGGVQFHHSVGHLFLDYLDCVASHEPELSAAVGGEGLTETQSALPSWETCSQCYVGVP